MKPVSRIWAIVACGALVGVLASCDSAGPLLERFEPRGSYRLAWNALPAVEGVADVRIGGFTGLWHLSGRHFFTITDRGPVLEGSAPGDSSRFFLATDFVPEVVKLALQEDGTIRIVERIALTAPTGRSASGLPPPAPWHAREAILNEQASNPDDWGIHPGGVAMDRKNNFFWVGDHYGPGLFQLTVEGKILRRVRAHEGLRRAYATRRRNGGFSGVGIEPSGQVVGIMRRSLDNRLAAGDVVNDSLRRIVQFDQKSGEERSLFYIVAPESVDGVKTRDVQVTGLAVVRDKEYLVTEHANVDGRVRNLLFAVTVADSTTRARPGLEGIIGKTIETLTESEWREAGLVPVAKRLLADLSAIGLSRVDGVAVVGRRHVALLEGNGYGIVDGDAKTRGYRVVPRDVRIAVVELEEEL